MKKTDQLSDLGIKVDEDGLETLYLNRTTQTQNETLGIFFNATASFLLATIELPWRDNKNGISCIPDGRYKFVSYFSPRHQRETWQAEGTEPRENVQIDIANWAYQLKGCIALGLKHNLNVSPKMVVSSELAFKKLVEYIGRNKDEKLKSFWLEIVTKSTNQKENNNENI